MQEGRASAGQVFHESDRDLKILLRIDGLYHAVEGDLGGEEGRGEARCSRKVQNY